MKTARLELCLVVFVEFVLLVESTFLPNAVLIMLSMYLTYARNHPD